MVFVKAENEKKLVFLILLLFGALYTLIVCMNHYLMRTNALDYGFYNQSFWNFAHLRLDGSTVFEPQLNNYFQIHPAFILPIISPLYWILNFFLGTYTLLIIQNVFIIAGAYGTYLYVRVITSDYKIALLALIHFNLIWGHYSAIAFEYIDTTVAASVVPLFLYFFQKKKFIIGSLCFVFVLIAKENMSIWFIFIGITLAILNRNDKVLVRAAILCIIVSLAYMIMTFQFIIPYFEDPNIPYWGFAYKMLGDNIKEVIIHILTHPWKTFILFFQNHSGDQTYDWIKTEFYIVFLLSGGIILFFRPVLLLWFIPLVAQKMLNDSYVRWGINIFYSIEIVSILSLAVFTVFLKTNNKKWVIPLYIAIILITAFTTLSRMNYRVSKWYDKSKECFFVSKFYSVPYDPVLVRENISSIIPENASVSASTAVVPHIAYREKVYLYPYVHDAKYIVILEGSPTYPLNYDQLRQNLDILMNNPEWALIYDQDYLKIFQRALSSQHKN